MLLSNTEHCCLGNLHSHSHHPRKQAEERVKDTLTSWYNIHAHTHTFSLKHIDWWCSCTISTVHTKYVEGSRANSIWRIQVSTCTCIHALWKYTVPGWRKGSEKHQTSHLCSWYMYMWIYWPQRALYCSVWGAAAVVMGGSGGWGSITDDRQRKNCWNCKPVDMCKMITNTQQCSMYMYYCISLIPGLSNEANIRQIVTSYTVSML